MVWRKLVKNIMIAIIRLLATISGDMTSHLEEEFFNSLANSYLFSIKK